MDQKVIIIGSGLGGLVCATLLAHRGLKVTVLERQRQAGGCMQSYRRGQDDYDTGLHYVGGLGEGQILDAAFRKIGLRDLPWVRLDADGFDRITIGGAEYRYAEGYNRFVATLAEQFPAERTGLQSYVDKLQEINDHTLQWLNGQAMEFPESVTVGAWDYLHTIIRDERLIQILGASSQKMELRKDTLPLFNFAHGNSSFIASSWRLKGGGSTLVDRLVSMIEKAGGEVLCRKEVEELIVRDHQVVAARCSDGSVYEGSLFISDIHPALLQGMFKEKIGRGGMFFRRMTTQPNTMGMLTVSLKLKDGQLPYFNDNRYVYRTTDVWGYAEQNRPDDVQGLMISCRVPDDLPVAVDGKVDDRSCCYARQLDLLTPMPWKDVETWSDTKTGRRGTDYLAMKQKAAEQCVALAETVIPGLRDMVVESYVSTPLTWRDYDQTPFGSAFGLRKDFHQPLQSLVSAQSPVRNLFLTGQSLMLHGVEGVMMTALNLCEQVLPKWLETPIYNKV
ncbi:MAG: NAD(P)/FAD-dependent oxidoreductase [Prevotellaceae bacterium]|nr:NAD(P)/FAD-dependent oxidoreductase [Prevotellaceae bacterium]